MNNKKLTCKELKDILNYNPDTGVFIWVDSKSPRIKNGSVAGCIFKNGGGKSYRQIRVKGKLYQSHRLAFLYMTCNWPEDQIDHINGDGTDNRWLNLRLVTHQENHKNRKLPNDNKSGVAGVSFTKRGWQASISDNKKRVYLGVFKDFFEAVCVRKSAENKCSFHENHGQVRPL